MTKNPRRKMMLLLLILWELKMSLTMDDSYKLLLVSPSHEQEVPSLTVDSGDGIERENLLVDDNESRNPISNFTLWVALVEIFLQIFEGFKDTTGNVLYESTTCISIVLSQVLRASPTSTMTDALKQVLDHAKSTGLVDQLCLSLSISGTSLISGSLDFLPAASEACRAIWLLIGALESCALREYDYTFPLDSFQSHSWSS